MKTIRFIEASIGFALGTSLALLLSPLYVIALGVVGAIAANYVARRIAAKLEGRDNDPAASDAAGSANPFSAAQLVHHIASAILVYDDSGKLLYCNPFTEVLTGHSVQSIMNHGGDFLRSITHPEDSTRFEKAHKVARSGEAFQFRFRFFHHSGLEMSAELRAVPFAVGPHLHAVLCSVNDVTAMVRSQRQVEQKSRDIEDFAYFLTHDLRAPLLTIKGMTSVLVDDAEQQGGDAKDACKHILQATERMEQLIASILEYSKIGALGTQLGPVRLKPVIIELLGDVARQLPDAKLECSIEDSLIIQADEVKIYQIFSNLVRNSVTYREKSRTFSLEISQQRSARPGTTAITVRDNGIGISGDKIGQVFRLFHRAHPEMPGGVGIGLASVERLTQLLGGQVSVESKVDEGTVFTVTLRLAESQPNAPVPTSATQAQ